jgi:hypothetical protein
MSAEQIATLIEAHIHGLAPAGTKTPASPTDNNPTGVETMSTRVELDYNELHLTVRALNEMQQRGGLNDQENSQVVNLVDYLENEAKP